MHNIIHVGSSLIGLVLYLLLTCTLFIVVHVESMCIVSGDVTLTALWWDISRFAVAEIVRVLLTFYNEHSLNMHDYSWLHGIIQFFVVVSLGLGTIL